MVETLIIASTVASAVGQIASAQAKGEALEQQAENRQIQAEQQVAQEEAAAESEALTRARQLRRSVGEQIAKAERSGITIGSGSVGDVIEDSEQQFSREQGIREFNTQQSTSSTLLSAQADANTLRARANNERFSGFVRAAGTIGQSAFKLNRTGSSPDSGGKSGGGKK